MDKSGNPALGKSALDRIKAIETTDHATISGTVMKIVFLTALLLAGGFFGWRLAANNAESMGLIVIGSLIAATILAFVTIFVPKVSPITSPLYAALEGIVLGAITQVFEETYPGIAIQAVGLTVTVLASVLVLYTSRIVRVTEKTRAVILVATLGIALYYVLAFVFRLFGIEFPLIYDTGTFGIIFSVIVVVVAALNLLLDFDFIERTAENKAPKVFEWYGAFGLMVTLVWLYLEILRLFSKLRR